jgi:hypothetical protein
MRWLAALALLCASNAARADYVYDPSDLPKGFVCEEDWNADNCAAEKRWDAWWSKYQDRYDRWYFGLLYNTDFYFQLPDGDQDFNVATRAESHSPNLVDVVYEVALRRYSGGWAFAIDMVCSDNRLEAPQSCAPKLRMVTFRKPGEIDPALEKRLKKLLPTSPDEVVVILRASAKWEEVDLRSCKGALDQLLAFPAQTGKPIWHPVFAEWLRGNIPKTSDELIVTADGDGVTIRATPAGDPRETITANEKSQVVMEQWNGGEGYDWALKMAEVIRPCLRPASSPAPWDRIPLQKL